MGVGIVLTAKQVQNGVAWRGVESPAAAYQTFTLSQKDLAPMRAWHLHKVNQQFI